MANTQRNRTSYNKTGTRGMQELLTEIRHNEDFDLQEARLRWASSLTDVDVRALTEDFRQGVLGDDVADAFDEYYRRWPVQRKPAKAPRKGRMSDGAQSPLTGACATPQPAQRSAHDMMIA